MEPFQLGVAVIVFLGYTCLEILADSHATCWSQKFYNPIPDDVDTVQYSVANGHIVLLGTIEMQGCNSTQGFCGSRQVHLTVSCILKDDGLPIASYISIGSRPYRPECNETILPFNARKKEYIVIIKRDLQHKHPTVNFDWDEVVPNTKAAIFATQEHLGLATQVCGVDPRAHPHSRGGSSCPQKPDNQICDRFGSTWHQTKSYGSYRISSGVLLSKPAAAAACEALGARLLYVTSASELRTLRRMLPDGGQSWWTSGILQDDTLYWQKLIHGEKSNLDLSNDNPPSDLFRRKHLIITKTSWSSTDDVNKTLPFICKMGKDSNQTVFLQDDFVSMGNIDIVYSQLSGNVELCCQSVSYDKGEYRLTNLEGGMMLPYYLQNPPSIRLTYVPPGYYTFMILDMTGPKAPYILFWEANIVTGIPDPSRASVVLPYQRPLPRERHNFLFVTFRQLEGFRTIQAERSFSYDTSCEDRYRCKIDMKQLVIHYSLQPVNVQPLSAEPDAYVTSELMSQRKESPQDTCRREYPDANLACIVNGSTQLRFYLTFNLLCFIIMYLLKT